MEITTATLPTVIEVAYAPELYDFLAEIKHLADRNRREGDSCSKFGATVSAKSHYDMAAAYDNAAQMLAKVIGACK